MPLNVVSAEIKKKTLSGLAALDLRFQRFSFSVFQVDESTFQSSLISVEKLAIFLDKLRGVGMRRRFHDKN